jgi:hypothetical protein
LSLYASSLSANGALARVAPAIGGIVLVAHIATDVMPSWMPLA